MLDWYEDPIMKDHELRNLFNLCRYSCESNAAYEPMALFQKIYRGYGYPAQASYFLKLKQLELSKRKQISDAYSEGQLESKLWLIDVLRGVVPIVKPYVVVHLGGWVGTLGACLLWQVPQLVKKVISIDIDPFASEVAYFLNRYHLYNPHVFKPLNLDMHDLHWSELSVIGFDRIIVNTSCEHISDFANWFENLPKNEIIILQSNDFYEGKDHINCVKNLAEFEKQTPFSIELYSGYFQLPQYKRFMRIGLK